ncbi:MAG: hypothetical protein IKL24_05885 [Clostridia bacterium]|nr:hypothetical protein [Clostridia bacterium]
MDTEYLKKVGLYVLSAILCIGVIIYFGYHLWHSFTREIETEVAGRVTFQQTIEAKGYIFRTETPVNSTGAVTSLVPSLHEGERVKKGGEVARVYSASSPETVERIADIEGQIKLLERYSNADNLTLKDTAGIDREIYAILASVRETADGGRLNEAAEYKQDLLNAVGERNVLTGGFADPVGEIEALIAERDQLVATLGAQTGSVYSSVSGFYYSESDGYEEIFRAEDLEDVTLGELRGLLESDPSAPSNAGKTVTRSQWFLVCMIEEEEKNTYVKNGKCTVRFGSSETILEMDVYNVLYDKEGTALILTSTRMPDGFDFYRTQDVELMKSELTGLRVPANALRMVDGETGVFILDVSTVSFRSVEIIYRDENSYIVKIGDDTEEDEANTEPEDTGKEETEQNKKSRPLRMHDIIIVEGKGLYEGRVIGN